MSSIERLSLQGIRSFSPKVPQEIVFDRPLTVILGKNGAGKTTLIEAILNACTGEFPPGAGSERGLFIYDPKLLGESEVKGQIRLEFTDREAKRRGVIRSYRYNIDARVKFNSMDTLFVTWHAETKKYAAHRTGGVGEVNQLVSDLMGVSKAVLEHVVFCHQEKATWPLNPAKDVKEIFDEIFASTRYNSAIDELRKCEKTHRGVHTACRESLGHLERDREEAKQIQADINKNLESMRLCKMRIDQTEPRLKQLEKAIADLDAVTHNANSLLREADILRGRIEEKRSQIAAVKLPPTKQTYDELRSMHANFDAHMKRLENELVAKQAQFPAAEEVQRKAEAAGWEAARKVEECGRQDTEHKQRLAELQGAVQSMTSEFVVGESEMDERALGRIENAFVAKLNEAKSELQRARDHHREASAAVLKVRDGTRQAMCVEEVQSRTLTDSIPALQSQLDALKAKVTTEEKNKSTAKQLEKRVAALTSQREAALKEKKGGSAYKQGAQLLEAVAAQQQKVSALRGELASLKDQSADAVRMAYLREQSKEKLDAGRKHLRDIVVPMLSRAGGRPLRGAVNVTSVAAAWESLKAVKAQAIGQTKEEIRQVDREVASLEEALAVKSRRLEDAQLELQRCVALCVDVLGTEGFAAEYNALLQQSEEEVLRCCNHVASIEAMGKCLTTLVEEAKRGKSCPLCSRKLSDADLAELVRNCDARQKSSAPPQVAKAKQEGKTAAEHHAKVQKVGETVRRVQSLRDEVAAVTREMKLLSDRLPAKKALLSDLTAKNAELEKQDEAVRDVHDELRRAVALLDDAEGMKKERDRLGARNSSASGAPASRALQEVEQEHETASTELQAMNEQLHELHTAAARGVPLDIELEEELSKARAELSDARNAVERQQELREQLTAKEKELTAARKKLEGSQKNLQDLQKDFEKQTASIAKLSANFEAECKERTTAMEGLEKNLQMLRGVLNPVKEYIKGNKGEMLSAARNAAKLAETTARQRAQDTAGLRKNIDELNQIVNEQHVKRNELNSHLRVFELQRELEHDANSLNEIERKHAELRSEQVKHVQGILGPNASPSDTILKTINDCRAKLDELRVEMAKNEGMLAEKDHSTHEKKTLLAKERYHDIDKRYAVEFIKVHTTKLAIEDIQKYYIALEKAINTYHQDKIAQVNGIVGDLWRQTYRGSDIDAIEIRSEDDDTTSAGRTKRSYRYRVVMKRGEHELDMRGRCSAGQKVLASIVIRLALSEAFCTSCGILALDEPTTNLDEDNSRSLAEALKELIRAEKERRSTHFQLLIITHDEEFIRHLGPEHVSKFHYIQKDREGAFSAIQTKNFQDLANL